MSRVVVKNLPKNITEDKLRHHFGSQFDITDVSLKYSSDGKFRGFAFIGFRQDEAAAAAVEANHQSFVGRNRVTVEIYDAEAVPIKERLEKGKKRQPEKDELQESKKKKLDNPMDQFKDDPAFQEFLAVQRNVNDTVQPRYAWKDDVGLKTKDKEEVDSGVDGVSEEETSKKTSTQNPAELPFSVKLSKLPYKVKKSDIKSFFQPLSLARVKLPAKIKGIAYVSFKSEKDLEKGLLKHKSLIHGKQVDVVRFKDELVAGNIEKSAIKEKKYHKIKEDVSDTGRLYVRNLSYTCTSADMEDLFSPFGPLTEVYLPIDATTKKPKGFAFVTFVFPEHAVKAMDELDKSIFQGRLIHILAGESKPESVSHLNNLSSFQKKKEEDKKMEAKKASTWNSLFLGVNAAAEIMTDKFAVKKAQLLADTTTKDSIAVRMALGETQIVNETKKFLIENGIDLNSFEEESNQGGMKKGRSKNVILVKNLPSKTDSSLIQELFSRHGTVSKVILPPHGVTAIVEMPEEVEAKKAFDRLINYKVHHVPIYLEWAPVNVFIKSQNKSVGGNEINEDHDSHQEPPDQDVSSSETGFRLFIKNVNFDTSDETFREHFSVCGTIVSAQISRNKSTGLSNGYGFVTFKTKKSAEKALRTLQNSKLDGHELQVEKSVSRFQMRSPSSSTPGKGGGDGVCPSQGGDSSTTSPPAGHEEKSGTTNDDPNNKKDDGVCLSTSTAAKSKTPAKILVRNVPFEASVKEVEQVFSSFGSLKSVRMPLKLGRQGHRGFAFVEYVTISDAKRAFESMKSSTHLYGRRLVLEWANSEGQGPSPQDEEEENIHHQKTSLGPAKGKRLKKSDLISRLQFNDEGGDDDD